RDAGKLAATPIAINTDMPAAMPNIIPTFVPIDTPLKLNLTFERSLMQWSFPLQVGTPPQTLKIAIDTTYNLLWVASQLCMIPWGNACGNLTNFFNTSLSNTSKSEIEDLTIKYIDGTELVGIWASDTIIINNQTFEQMQIGLPKDIKENENISITITNTNAGQLGLKAYQNNQTMGIALSTKSEDLGNGGSITFGGLDLGNILGYEIQDIQFDDNSARIIVNNLPGGNYSNGVAMVDCNIPPTFDIFFEIANHKWRLPSSAIIKGVINGTDKCESIITGGAINSPWVFGSAFITTQVAIWIQLPTLIPSDIKCLIITDSDGNVQSISEDIYVDPNDYFRIPNYVAKQGFSYTFAFYSGPPNDGSSCSGNFLVETPYLMADITNNPWLIGRTKYSVQGIKVQVSENEAGLSMLILYYDNYVYKYEEYHIDNRDNDGYYYIDYLVYESAIYTFCAFPAGGSCNACGFGLIPTMVGSPWTITSMGSCDMQCG
ncbi:14266_t:CDS:2, partial [Gigaspora margarita]